MPSSINLIDLKDTAMMSADLARSTILKSTIHFILSSGVSSSSLFCNDSNHDVNKFMSQDVSYAGSDGHRNLSLTSFTTGPSTWI